MSLLGDKVYSGCGKPHFWYDLRGRCYIKNVVYHIDCKLSPLEELYYIEETRHSVRRSYNEHIRNAKNNKT